MAEITDVFRRKMADILRGDADRLVAEAAAAQPFQIKPVEGASALDPRHMQGAVNIEEALKDRYRQIEREAHRERERKRMDDLMKQIMQQSPASRPILSMPQHRDDYINLESEGRMQKHQPCDVVVSPDHRIYINGNEIGWVTEVEFTQDYNSGPELVLRLRPTSITQGQPPREQLEDMVADQTVEVVDVNKAMQRAQERAKARRVVGRTTPVKEMP